MLHHVIIIASFPTLKSFDVQIGEQNLAVPNFLVLKDIATCRTDGCIELLIVGDHTCTLFSLLHF